MLVYNYNLIKNTNNTSIPFFLPSEFKLNWENMLKDQLMESFENIFDDYIWLTHIFQDTFITTYTHTNSLIQNKLKNILEILNLKDNNSENFLNRFRSLFQDYFQLIFVFNDEFFNCVKNNLLICIEKYNDCNRLNDIKKDINSRYFHILIQSLFKLSIYMLLHDPLINLNIKQYEERKIEYHFFNKNLFLTVEGFGKDRTPCAVLLNPPTFKNNFIFQGIKPAIYCLSPVINNDVIEECEISEKAKIKTKENDYNTDKEYNLTFIKEIKNESKSLSSNLQSQNISVLDDQTIVQKIKFESPCEKIDCFEQPLKRDSSNIQNKNLEPSTTGNYIFNNELKNSTIQNTISNKEKDYLCMSEDNKKKSNIRSNSELIRNENSIHVCENDLNLNNSCTSSENIKNENSIIKTVDKIIYSSNIDKQNHNDKSQEMAILMKKKNMNFANNFLDSFNKNNINTFKSSLQHKAKINSTHSCNHKINSKELKNNFIHTNRDNNAFKTKHPVYSLDNQKKKDSSANKIFDKNLQKGLHSPELANSNFSKLNSVFSKESTNNNFFTKRSVKNRGNSPKVVNNFMKMKSLTTIKNSIKNAYIEYISSKANNDNLNYNIQKKLNLNSSNPSSKNINNNIPISNIKSNLNSNSININAPQSNNNRNEKNLLVKNLTDKTNSKQDNNGNDHEYILNSENIVDFSNRNLFELNIKTPEENMTYIEQNHKTCDLRYSKGYKREKEGFYSTNYISSKRESIPKDEKCSNNSTNENFNKKEKKSNISPKSENKTNYFLPKDHSSLNHEKNKTKGFEPSKTSKPEIFKNLQKSLKNSNKFII